MSYEIGSIDTDGLERYSATTWAGQETAPTPKFHEAIHSQENGNWRFTRNAVVQTAGSDLTQRTQTIARVNGKEIVPMESGGSVSGGFDIKWDGKNGVEYSAHFKGEVHDNKGNSAEAKAEVKSDGSAQVSCRGKHEENSDKK